jgi:DNA-binding MarR family transcriptional regulator
MEPSAHRELKVLQAIAEDEQTTQRGLASKLGIALGLTNLYLKRLVRKGYIKCVNIQSNRVRYLITPKGIAEKMRLTYEYMDYSFRIFQEGRNHLQMIVQAHMASPTARVALYGTGEASQLAFLCLRELHLEPVAAFDGRKGGSFLGLPILDIADHASVDYDLLIVGTMEPTVALVGVLMAAGVPPAKLVTLRPVPDLERVRAVGK